MTRWNANRTLALLIGILSLIYLVAAYRIPTFPIPRPIDSDSIPKVLGFVMLCLSVWLFFERPHDGDAVVTRSRSELLQRWMPVIVTAVSVAVYAALLEWLGFLLASFLLVGGLTRYFGYTRHAVNACVAFLVPLVLYLVMTRLMTVHLPRGLLPF